MTDSLHSKEIARSGMEPAANDADKKYRSAQTDAIYNALIAILALAERLGQTDVANMAEKSLSQFCSELKKYAESRADKHELKGE